MGRVALALLWLAVFPRASGAQDPEAGAVPELHGAASIALSPDGKLLAAVYSPSVGASALGLWTLPDQKELRKNASVPFGTTSLSFFPDGRTLVAAGFSGKLLAWGVEDLKEVASVPLQAGMGGLQVSPDGKLVIAAGDPIHVWDAATWKEQASVTPGALVTAFQPGSHTLILGVGRGIRFWDLDAGKELRSLANVMAISIAVSPDGKVLATGVGSTNVTLVEAETGKVVLSIKAEPGSPIGRFEFSSGGKTLVTANTDESITIFDSGTGKLIRKVKTPGTGNLKFHTLRLTPDGKTAAWVTSDRPSQVRVLRLD